MRFSYRFSLITVGLFTVDVSNEQGGKPTTFVNPSPWSVKFLFKLRVPGNGRYFIAEVLQRPQTNHAATWKWGLTEYFFFFLYP